MSAAGPSAITLTPRAAALLEGARGPADLLRRLLDSGQVDGVLRELSVDPGSLRSLDLPDDGDQGTATIVANAAQEAALLGHGWVDSVHLLLGLRYNDVPNVARALAERGVGLYELRSAAIGSAPAGASRVRPRAEVPAGAAARVSPAFLVPVLAFAAGGVMLYLGPPSSLVTPLTILFVAGGWVVSLCLHEFGHALVAYLGGDRSVVGAGYLTLNPLRYTHVWLSIVMPLVFLLIGGIGLPGGAVYIDHSALRSRLWDAGVSAAGPAMTLVFTLLVAWPFALGRASWFSDASLPFWAALAWLVVLEVGALLLNLIPVPPFDGWGIVSSTLSWETRIRVAAIGSFGVFAVLILLWVTPVGQVFWGYVYSLADLMQVPGQLADLGRFQMTLVRQL
jgi:Zn-dependent protease